MIPAKAGATTIPTHFGVESVLGGLLAVAALCYPFSVAATNAILGSALVVGILSGRWWDGAGMLWRRYRSLCVAALLYWGLMLLGLSWSGDRTWGAHVLGRQWYWLLPPVLAVTLSRPVWRWRFLGLLSLALAAHLVFCILQMFGYVTGTTAGGSFPYDATGHIGHIGFGVVYGMWAGWLLHWGWLHSGPRRYLAWLLAAWAWVMIFLAQGRSGYLAAFAVLFVFLCRGMRGWRRWGLAAGFVLLMFTVLALGPGKERLLETEQSVVAGFHGDVQCAGFRWSMWLGALYAWREHPILGVGTGGFPRASVRARARHPWLDYGGPVAVHPHNMYLLALARWGVPGIIALGLLFFFWIRTGWKKDWRASDAGALITLSGVALAVHAMTAPSLEEHFEDILAVLMLGAGLAASAAGEEA